MAVRNLTSRRPAVRVGTYNHKDSIRALVAISIVLAFVTVETVGSVVGDTRHFGDHHFGDVTLHAIHFIGTGNVLLALGIAAIIALGSLLVVRFPLSEEACEALSRKRDR
jgi:hypothetical protein